MRRHPIIHPDRLDAEALASDILDENPVLYGKIAAAGRLQGQDTVHAVMVEVVRFLYLIGYFRQRLTPSVPVDLAWHEFILCTRMYSDFCERLFGRFLHHQPGGEESENRANFRKTLASYRLCYGEPPSRFWPVGDREAPGCGGCEA